MKIKLLSSVPAFICFGSLIFFSCGANQSSHEQNVRQSTADTIVVPIENPPGYGKSFSEDSESKIGTAGIPPEVTKESISQVIFFIENSGSMKGYVTGSTGYVNILTDIANHPEFILNGIERLFYFGSGTSIPHRINNLAANLIPARFNQPRSDLNTMFKTALDSTKNTSISIIISDGIYDMCPDPTPLSKLEGLGYDLRTIFIRKLSNSDFQTILVKLSSNFNGMYYSGDCCGSQIIDQSRPYYMWIMGGSESLKVYFPDKYLEKLRGYTNSARFFKFDVEENLYMPVSYKLIGNYYPSRNDNFTLRNVSANKGIFQFTIAVDYSLIPLNDNYLKDTANYKCTNGFKIVAIEPPNPVTLLAFPKTTHLIVVRKTGNPIGELNVSLLKNGYEWISSTSTTNDCDILGNTNQTYGFDVLNKGIIEAYDYFNDSTEIMKFKINLQN